MPLKFVTVNDNVFQLLGDFVPQTPTGALPLDPAGGLPSPRPPCLCSSKTSLKNPLYYTNNLHFLVGCGIGYTACDRTGSRHATQNSKKLHPSRQRRVRPPLWLSLCWWPRYTRASGPRGLWRRCRSCNNSSITGRRQQAAVDDARNRLQRFHWWLQSNSAPVSPPSVAVFWPSCQRSSCLCACTLGDPR